MLWQHLLLVAQLSTALALLQARDDGYSNPFAAIEPSTSLNWTRCEILPDSDSGEEAADTASQMLECARFLVPFDASADTSSNDTDKQFSIAMVRSPATDTDNYKGPMFVGFGGPGVPGTLSLASKSSPFRADAFAEALSGYDLVTFDSRGVGNTLPAVSCFNTEEDRLAFTDSVRDFSVGQSIDAFIIDDARNRLLSASCAENAADLLPYIGTAYAVEDLRRMVEAYGYSDKLSFIGLSYGSLLGMTYAATYPDKVERLILDSIIDPVTAYTKIAIPEAYADHPAILQYFFSTCFEAGPSRCPFWFDGPDAIAEAYDQVSERLRRLPFIANGENNTKRIYAPTDLFSLAFASFYDPRAGFSALAQNLAAIYNNDPDGLTENTESPSSPSDYESLVDPGTKRSNGIESLYLIRCADSPEWLLGEILSLEEWLGYIWSEEVKQYGPIAQSTTQQLYGPCSRLRIDTGRRFEGRFSANEPIEISAPILFLSNRLDPVTPLSAAYVASSIFTNSAVVIKDEVGHVAAGANNECFITIIEAYLEDGTLPTNGTVCEPESGEGGMDSLFEKMEGDEGDDNDNNDNNSDLVDEVVVMDGNEGEQDGEAEKSDDDDYDDGGGVGAEEEEGEEGEGES